jgi:ribosomal 50S subunit-associated protein YjgA (DUF615 family)
VSGKEKPIKKRRIERMPKMKKQPEQLEPEQLEKVTLPEKLNALLKNIQNHYFTADHERANAQMRMDKARQDERLIVKAVGSGDKELMELVRLQLDGHYSDPDSFPF